MIFLFLVSKFRKKILTNVAVILAKDNLPGLEGNLSSSTINKFDRKISGKGPARWRNEDMNDIIKIIKSLEDSGVSIDGVTETVRYEMKEQDGRFLGALLAPLAVSLVQPVISSVVKGISERGVWDIGLSVRYWNFVFDCAVIPYFRVII